MPIREGFSFRQEAIGTGGWQPVWVLQQFRGYRHAIRDVERSVGVVATAAVVLIEVATYYVGDVDLAAIFVFETLQAALGAAIAQGFPLVWAEIGQWFVLPKPGIRICWGLFCHCRYSNCILPEKTHLKIGCIVTVNASIDYCRCHVV